MFSIVVGYSGLWVQGTAIPPMRDQPLPELM